MVLKILSIPLKIFGHLQDRTRGRLVVKRVRNQELAYRLVCIACTGRVVNVGRDFDTEVHLVLLYIHL